ncbi:MAG TPA: hypothetical protein VFL17_08010 [Anaerolineae bacterium]|nr:hypothetical protein [Anaerolineae bacterium]
MKRLSILTLVFAILSLVFIVLLVFLRVEFPLYPLLSYQDAFDVLTPLVLIPVYWLLFRYSAKGTSSLAEDIAFMVLAALWVEGQGLHLSANSINNLINSLARNQVIDVKATDIYHLTYFFDEQLGHYLWHVGMLGLAALLIYREWRQPAGLATTWWATLLAGIIYGFSYFSIFLEGQTVVVGLPFAIIVVGLTLIRGRRRLAQQPVLAFFFVACLVAFLLFAGWGLYWRGFPQFSDVGLI